MNPAVFPLSFVPLRAAALVGALALSVSLSSAAEVSAGPSVPAGTVLAANTAKTPLSTIGWKHDGAANQWFGVTFDVSRKLTLDKISLAYASAGEGAAGAVVTLRLIRLDLGGSFVERINQGSVLRTDTFTLPSPLPAGGWLTFDLTDTVLPAAPISYAYILSFNQRATNRFVNFTRGNADANGAIGVGVNNAVFRSETGEGAYAAIGNPRTGTAAFPHMYFLGSDRPAAD